VEFKLHKDNVKPRVRPLVETNGAKRAVNSAANGVAKRTVKARRVETPVNGVAAKP
jgi:hypothetical protein